MTYTPYTHTYTRVRAHRGIFKMYKYNVRLVYRLVLRTETITLFLNEEK